MTWLLPLDIGLIMGLMFAWPVLALTASFRLFNFPDLTLEGSFPIGAAVFAVGAVHHWPLAISLVAAIAAGGVVGATTALIHTRLHVNKFLAGILVVAMSYTLSLRIMASPNIGLIGQTSPFDFIAPLNRIAPQVQLGAILLLVALLAVGVIGLLALFRSPWGLRLRVAGSNPTYGEAIGIRAEWQLMAGLAITNSLAAGGGALVATYQGFTDVSMGQGGLILALASMTIGERLVPQRSLSITAYALLAAVVGAVVYQVLVAYALRLGLAATDLKLVTALFVLVVIGLQVRRRDDNFLEVMG